MLVLAFSDTDRFSYNVYRKIERELNNVREFSNMRVSLYRETPVILIRGKDLPFIEKEELDKALTCLSVKDPKIVFISRHEMRSPKPMLTVHTSGNWGRAEYGGVDNEVSICNACLNSNIIRYLKKLAEERELSTEYDVIMEATHHGPSIDYESCFVEVGSTEREWSDVRCINLFVDLIEAMIGGFNMFLRKIGKVTISIGDLHYCTLMNYVLNGEIDLGHTIPKYVEISEKNVRDAIVRTMPEIERVIVHWKSLKRDTRELVLKVLENYSNIEIIKRK